MDKEPGQRSFELWDEKVWRGRGGRLLWPDLDGETKTFWAELETSIEAPRLAEIEQLKAKVAELEASHDAVVWKLGEAIELILNMRAFLIDGEGPRFGYRIMSFERMVQEPPSDLSAPGRDRPLRVYVAGGSSERMLVQGWIDELVRHGVEVTYDWTRDPGWSLGRMPTNEELADAATRDLAGIDAADLAWRIVPVKLSEGSADEGGYARARGKRIVVSGAVGSRNVFELLPDVTRFATHEEAAAHIVGIAKPYQCTPCLTWQEPEYGGRCRACGGSKEEHEGRS